MRRILFEIYESDPEKNRGSFWYSVFMVIIVHLSILPLMFEGTYEWFYPVEMFCLSVFIMDYILRWITADFKMGKKWFSFILYPFTPMAIIDLLSILPGFKILADGFKILRIARLFRLLMIFKFLSAFKEIALLIKVLRQERRILMSVLLLTCGYVFISALVMFNVEPHINPFTGEVTFNSFFDALYWATVTLTTVGYGDLCPVTSIGRLISMISTLFGVIIIALPSGIITAAYLNELRNMDK